MVPPQHGSHRKSMSASNVFRAATTKAAVDDTQGCQAERPGTVIRITQSVAAPHAGMTWQSLGSR